MSRVKHLKMLIDIGANLTDGMYKGVYHGIKRHDPDLDAVLSRAWQAGLKHIIVTGSSLSESREALKLVQQDERLTCTVGCHPTRCGEFEECGDPNIYLRDLENLVKEAGNKISALGEFGLDYDRLHFCERETQIKYLRRQLELAARFDLPLFLHCRAAAPDLVTVLKEQPVLFRGVIHSFDGSIEDAEKFMELGYYIGINGCSLKSAANIEVVKQLPLERILIETDAPWCEIRVSYAGAPFIKSPPPPSTKKEKWKPNCIIKCRNEPCCLGQILEIVSNCRGEDKEKVAAQVYLNTTTLFPNLA